jgi:hypothetical protein
MAISRDAFAHKMMKALGKAGVGQLEYDAERFALGRPDGDRFFLDSAFQFYRQAPFWKRGGVVKYYAQTMFNKPLSQYPKRFDDARANLVPVVHTMGYLDVAELLVHGGPASADDETLTGQFVPLAGTLCYGLAYDTPQTLGMFSAKQLAEWGVTFEDAMKSARYNLSVRSRDPLRQVAPGLFMAPWQDANASARLLLTEVLTRLPVKGDVVASVPGRDYLLVAGSDDPDALGAMVAVAAKALAAPKAKTPEMFRLHGTSWVPFTLPAEHPAAARHQELVYGLIGADYAEQKKLIDEANEKSGTDIFVGNYTAIRPTVGPVYSVCSWAPCVSLLPRTERIAIVDTTAGGEKARPLVVPWEAAVAIVGHRMKQQPRYRLERYLVEEFPSESEMAELRARAVAV